MKIFSKTNINQTPIQKFFHSAQKCLLLASATLLASTLSLEASAFTLRRAEEGNVIGIDNLDIEGEVYNVEFVLGNVLGLYGSASVSGHKPIIAGSNPFDFSTKAAAEVAFLAVSEALGSEEFISKTPIFGGTFPFMYIVDYEKNDNFRIPFGKIQVKGLYQNQVYTFVEDKYSEVGEDEVSVYSRYVERGGSGLFAKFSKAPAAVATPEPSLVLGFITLGGLMLGSKRKTEG